MAPLRSFLGMSPRNVNFTIKLKNQHQNIVFSHKQMCERVFCWSTWNSKNAAVHSNTSTYVIYQFPSSVVDAGSFYRLQRSLYSNLALDLVTRCDSAH